MAASMNIEALAACMDKCTVLALPLLAPQISAALEELLPSATHTREALQNATTPRVFDIATSSFVEDASDTDKELWIAVMKAMLAADVAAAQQPGVTVQT
jgi:hypothetical protein